MNGVKDYDEERRNQKQHINDYETLSGPSKYGHIGSGNSQGI